MKTIGQLGGMAESRHTFALICADPTYTSGSFVCLRWR